MSDKHKTSQSILIRGGKVVNADKTELTDVLIENGVVKQMGQNLKTSAGTKIISAENMYVIPGGIDPHTHFEFDFMGSTTIDDFYAGTRAAVAGGTTTIMDFAVCSPGQSPLQRYKEYRIKADGKVCCDYALHVGITWWSKEVAKEMDTLCSEHGINSFKVFLAYKGSLMVDDETMYDVFSKCKENGAVGMVHAENGTIIAKNAERLKASGITGPEGHALSRPPEVEAEAVNRASMIANQVGSPLYVVHVMTKDAASIIAKRRSEGQTTLYGETLSSTLAVTAPKTNDFAVGAGNVMSPPIPYDPSHSEAIINYLKSNDLLLIASDNASWKKNQKALGKGDFTKIPSGVNGVEERMYTVWEKCVNTKKFDVQKFVELTSTNAAKFFNIYPKKGCINVGSDADIVIWNPKKVKTISAKTHHHGSDFNIFEGITVHGAPEIVLVKGQICFENDEVKAIKGLGEYLKKPCYSPFVYGS